MTAKERIHRIRLMEKIKRNPDYAKKLGIESCCSVLKERGKK